MKDPDRYHKWIEWSEEDQVYIGKCPDLITGIHGDDPLSLYAELCDVIEDVIRHFQAKGRALPQPRIRRCARWRESMVGRVGAATRRHGAVNRCRVHEVHPTYAGLLEQEHWARLPALAS